MQITRISPRATEVWTLGSASLQNKGDTVWVKTTWTKGFAAIDTTDLLSFALSSQKASVEGGNTLIHNMFIPGHVSAEMFVKQWESFIGNSIPLTTERYFLDESPFCINFVQMGEVNQNEWDAFKMKRFESLDEELLSLIQEVTKVTTEA